MRSRLWPLLLVIVVALTACATTKSENSTAPDRPTNQITPEDMAKINYLTGVYMRQASEADDANSTVAVVNGVHVTEKRLQWKAASLRAQAEVFGESPPDLSTV